MSNENRALDETWEVNRYVVEMQSTEAGNSRQLGQFIDDDENPDWPSCDRDRAQLAAAAPEMARLLLSMVEPEGRHCRVCGNCTCGGETCGVHDADRCPGVAALRKAGVM